LRVLLISLFLFSCSYSGRPLYFNLANENLQLDWNRAIDSNSILLLDNVMEGLTTYSNSTQNMSVDLIRPTPALAASWSISDGGKTYLFRLKKGVLWSDGVELEAKHFVDSWERLLSPKLRSANAYHLFDIENAQSYNESKEKDFRKIGVKALDRYTLQVKLRRQVPYFLHLVATANTFPIRKDLIERLGESWAEWESIVTLGAYRIVDWKQGEAIHLQANASYFESPPAIQNVYLRLVSEPLAAFAFFENQQMDILRDLPQSLIRSLQNRPEYRTGPKLQVSYLLLNTKKAPFQNLENRRAFIQSIKREPLTGFFSGNQSLAFGWLPPGLLGSQKNPLPENSLPLNAEKGKKVELRYSGGDTWNLVFQEISKQINDSLNWDVRLNRMETSEYGAFLAQLSTASRMRNMPNLMHLSWVADFPDSHSFMNVFTSASESNYTGWSNAAYDHLVETAVSTSDETVRSALYAQAQKILLEDAVILPLFLTNHQALIKSDLRGVHLNILDKWYFRNIRFESDGWRGFRNLWRKRAGKVEKGA
jgi:oligopeptide transport system substrate-binding protein